MSAAARGGLGKGLGALIPAGANSLEELPPSAISPNPRQPRRHFDDDALAGLSASIRQLGLLQPVVVRRSGGAGAYELVLGERRWRAAQKAGLTAIPAIVIDTDETGSLQRALVENVQRQDLNPIEEAAAYRQLVEEAGLTHEELAQRMGISRPAISNALRLLELPDRVQALVLQRKLSAGHARALLGLLGHPLLERLANRVAAAGLSVRETEELVKRERESDELQPAAAPSRRAEPADSTHSGLNEIADALSDQLQTRVKVSMGRGRGKIVIEFGSGDDLVRICRRIAAGGEESGSNGSPPGGSARATTRSTVR